MNTKLTGIKDFQDSNIVVSDTTINKFTLANACVLLAEQFPTMDNVPTTDWQASNGEFCQAVNIGSYTLLFGTKGFTIQSRDTFTFYFPMIAYEDIDILSFDTFLHHEKCVSIWIYLANSGNDPIRINTTRL